MKYIIIKSILNVRGDFASEGERGSPFSKRQEIVPFTCSLVPRAIATIEFGVEGDNCTVAKYNAKTVD